MYYRSIFFHLQCPYSTNSDKFSKDDFVGAIVLNMSEISVPGENGEWCIIAGTLITQYGCWLRCYKLVISEDFIQEQ